MKTSSSSASKYLLVPGSVTSRTDGQLHFISSKRLMRLYNVNPKDCIDLFDYGLSQRGKLYENLVNKGVIPLHPRYDGNYNVERAIQEHKERQIMKLHEQDIEKAVSRFLCWKLPTDFYPDNYISFNRPGPTNQMANWPTGTNLFHATQVKQMLLHILQDSLATEEQPVEQPQLEVKGYLYTNVQSGYTYLSDNPDLHEGDELWRKEELVSKNAKLEGELQAGDMADASADGFRDGEAAMLDRLTPLLKTAKELEAFVRDGKLRDLSPQAERELHTLLFQLCSQRPNDIEV